VPLVLGGWAITRIRGLLNAWMIVGAGILVGAFYGCDLDSSSPAGINLMIGILAVFILPRLVFYPLLRRQKRDATRTRSARETRREL